MGSEENFYQINHVGLTADGTKGVNVWTRDENMKLSNFGALNYGGRMSVDYTRTLLDFESKDDLSDVNVVVPEWQYAERNENPLLAGSTVKYTRDDQFHRMGMANNSTDNEIDLPSMDVMDTYATNGVSSGKNWPKEGWRSFGGKYDFAEAYNTYFYR